MAVNWKSGAFHERTWSIFYIKYHNHDGCFNTGNFGPRQLGGTAIVVIDEFVVTKLQH